MVLDLNEQIEMDLTVFDVEFDPHHRGLECKRLLKGIKANEHFTQEAKLSEHNQQKLLEYAAWMVRKIKRDELSTSSFEKNLSEAWRTCLFFGETQIDKVDEAKLKEWWESQLKSYEAKTIKWGTLRKKFECCQSILKFSHGINNGHKLPLMECIDIPKQPRRELFDNPPTQEQVKLLIDAAYASDKYSLRNQAILALANDTGARISEVLSMRNKHIRPEKNYLVVSFPESKTVPRTVISYLAKPFLEQWAKVSPNKCAGPEAFFFCKGDGKPITYSAIKRSFDDALKRTQIPWKKRQGCSFFQGLIQQQGLQLELLLEALLDGLGL